MSERTRNPLSWFAAGRRALQYGRSVLQRMREEELPTVAASLTFSTLLALVPLAAVTLAIFTAFPLFAALREALQEYFIESLMPPTVSDPIIGFFNGVAQKARSLTVFGLLFLFVSALLVLVTIENALNKIWRTQRRKGSWATRLLSWWGALTLGPVLLGFSLYLTGLAAAQVSGIKALSWVMNFTLLLVPVVLAALGWAIVYKTVPHATVRWKHALIGALLAAVCFELVKRGFASYLSTYANFRQLYGALSVVPIFLLWIYVCWLITLAGAVITALAPEWGVSERKREVRVGDPLADCLAAVKLLLEARTAAPFAMDFEDIAQRADIPRADAQAALDTLERLGWVRRVEAAEDRELTYVLAVDPHAVTLSPLLDATVLSDHHPQLRQLSAQLATIRATPLLHALG
jgi:membrane protein